VTDFSWLYGDTPSPKCKHCGHRINPCIKRERWSLANRQYVDLDPEVCDPCRSIHPVNDGTGDASSESTSPLGLSWLTTALTYLAPGPPDGRS